VSYAITYRDFLGDAERDFALTSTVVPELERLAGSGLGALFSRLSTQDFRFLDLAETIRLGLIGAGESPKEAARLVKLYVEDRPVFETLPVAVKIMEARFYGRLNVAPAPAPAPVEPVEPVEPVASPAEAPVEPTPAAAPIAPAPVGLAEVPTPAELDRFAGDIGSE